MSRAIVHESSIGRRHLQLRAPENVSIDFVLADLGTRIVALAADLGIIILSLMIMIVALVVFVSSDSIDETIVEAFLILLMFLWRHFYFTVTEVLGQGRTLGKRWLGLRVVARDGGPLTVERIFARNLTRDLEIFLPLSYLLSPESLTGPAPWWVQVSTGVWILVLSCLPLLNRHRARLGDLVAGTLVVFEPTGRLLDDLTLDAPLGGHGYTFSQSQLEIYGVKELQVLEDVLRRPPSEERERLLKTICEKVQRKIGWDSSAEPVNPKIFLQAFYTSQRARLEQKMLMGNRQDQKAH